MVTGQLQSRPLVCEGLPRRAPRTQGAGHRWVEGMESPEFLQLTNLGAGGGGGSGAGHLIFLGPCLAISRTGVPTGRCCGPFWPPQSLCRKSTVATELRPGHLSGEHLPTANG